MVFLLATFIMALVQTNRVNKLVEENASLKAKIEALQGNPKETPTKEATPTPSSP
jgi:hypothetical protein